MPNAARAMQFRRDYAVADITEIEFVGVRDTVGSLGIPVPFRGTLGEREFLFHDTEPSKIIQHARHAVAIDENRVDFEPTLWSDKPGLDLQQVWFAGVHSDIGGGYEERGLSDCAGQWMIREAGKYGLGFETHLANAVVPNPEDTQHNERKGIYRARKELVRSVTGPVHKTVKQRWLADAHGYQGKSKALRQMLDAVGGDWSKIEVMRQASLKNGSGLDTFWHCEVCMMYRYLVIVFMLFGPQVFAEPLSLSVTKISLDLAAETVDIKVVELHESDEKKSNTVTYRGIPLNVLLQYLYPQQWNTFEGEIYLYALDGYFSIVDAEKARQGDAYMTFARADGQPFTIDNSNQQERGVPLAPFYLVWDNLKKPELLTSNAYAWPYQVFSIELVSDSMLKSLLPQGASAEVEAGFDGYKNNCLSCHKIDGFGGNKFGMDIRQSIKGRSREELYEWIDRPSTINKFTTMPPLDPGVTGETRKQLINRIIDYLQAI